jgi:hypothetical protein
VVRAPPAPLPRLALNPRGLRLAAVGLLPAATLAGGFWLLAGQVFHMPLTQRLALGLLVGALSAALGAVLEGQLLWPLTWRGPLAGASQLPMVYGLGGALFVIPGGALIGVVVLADAFGTSVPGMPVVLTGAATGVFYVIFALPPGLLVGALAGRGLGALASRLRSSARFGQVMLAGTAWAAGLAWFAAGSVAGSVVGALVASQSNFNLAAGAYLGGLVQSVLAALLLPGAIRLLRQGLILAG